MKYVKYLAAALVLLVIAFAVVFVELRASKEVVLDSSHSVSTPSGSDANDASEPTPAPAPVLDEEGPAIQVTSPRSGESVGLPLTITGYARVFENQFAYRVKDLKGNLLKEGSAMSNATDSGKFGAFTITTNYAEPASTNGTVEVFEYSAKDGSEVNKVTVPVVFAATTSQEVSVFFSNSKKAGSSPDCSLVYAVERRVPKTEALGRAALEELLRGATAAEMESGYATNINSGVTIKSLSIVNKIATVRFNDAFEVGVAGSCRVAAIRAQVEQTLLQFSTVERVVIEVEGMPTDEVLQP
jgi:spore germination protein GerM